MLIASNITVQFGAKPLFDNVSVKFGDGNRYGLIGANGAGKSTFMKILAGELESSAGNVSLDTGERMAYLRQDQFAFEDKRVLDVVMMGHTEMWACMSERDAIYMPRLTATMAGLSWPSISKVFSVVSSQRPIPRSSSASTLTRLRTRWPTLTGDMKRVLSRP